MVSQGVQGREGGGKGGDEKQWELFPSPVWLSQQSRSSLPVSAPLFPAPPPKCWQNWNLPVQGCSPASHIHLDPPV